MMPILDSRGGDLLGSDDDATSVIVRVDVEIEYITLVAYVSIIMTPPV